MLSRSYLVEIQLEGQCDSKESRAGDPPVSVLGPDTRCPRLPPTTFRYHNPDFNPIGVHRIYIPPPWSLGGPYYTLFDVDRDGVPDLITRAAQTGQLKDRVFLSRIQSINGEVDLARTSGNRRDGDPQISGRQLQL
jgi:hypothetical protein